ncbi:MAG: hypothetical protein V3T01_03570, partial [Myxococcota bacterium]
MRARILFPLLLALAFPASAGALTAPASLEDIVLLAESGVSDETIRVFLNSRPLNFDLDADAIALLKSAGISEELLQHLLDSVGETASRTGADVVVVVAADPYPYHYYGSYYLPGATLHLSHAFPHWGFHFSFPFPFPIPVPHLSHTRHRVLRHDDTSHHLRHGKTDRRHHGIDGKNGHEDRAIHRHKGRTLTSHARKAKS